MAATAANRRPSIPVAPRDWQGAIWAAVAAFGCYFCVYGFRKPFTAGGFAQSSLGGLDFKTVLVICQVAGYTLSKFLGVRVIAELDPRRRIALLAALVLVAELGLLGLALIPFPWGAAGLVLNGLALGLVFGLVLGLLEGRQSTEALTAGLCTSFILADGVAKSVGTWLLTQGVPERWMPAAAGGLFLAPLALFVAMLARVPPPDAADCAARSERSPMDRATRWSFLRRYARLLAPLTLLYLLVTVVRSVRADFAPEIWRSLGEAAPPALFTRTELWVALGVLLANGAAVLIRDNRRAFVLSLATCGVGVALLGCATLGRDRWGLSPVQSMVLLGLGLYLPYVALHTTLFERLLGMTRERGNIGFLMYVVDSVGYLGYVAVMLLRNLSARPWDWLAVLEQSALVTSGVGLLCIAACALALPRDRHTTTEPRLAAAPEGQSAPEVPPR
jgi:hypothetical protein